MKGNGFRLLKTDIQQEIENLQQLQQEMKELLANIKDYPSRVELRAMGSVLHDFYSGAEKIFERIANEMDGGVPEGQQWHMQLLTRMASKVAKVRPAIIDRGLQGKLADYLRFRHLFRHAYGFELEWERLQPLAAKLPEVYIRFKNDLQKFHEYLDTLIAQAEN